MKDNYLIITSKQWNINLFDSLKKSSQDNWFLLTDNGDICLGTINEINPKIIFFPHWSNYINEDIYLNYECIVFHMTDLPFGRGGSPLQNLISRGIYSTKVTALKCTKEVDSGDIYLKKPLDLEKGSGEELYKKASQLAFDMIDEIIDNSIQPVAQKGRVTHFKRRTPAMSLLPKNLNEKQTYDYIRMLDAPGYPKAYIEQGEYDLIFDKAEFIENSETSDDGGLIAQVKFKKRVIK